MSLLEVDGLRVRLPGASGPADGRRRRRLPRRAGRGVRRRRRERQRQDDVDARAARRAARRRRRSRGACASTAATCSALSAARRRELAGRDLAMVFQDPMTSLHPMLTVGRQLTEHVRLHLGLRPPRRPSSAPSSCSRRCASRTGPRRCAPTRTSSRAGCAQRIAIAIALACRPKLLIADEPTTALDVTVQAGILRLLDRLRRENDLAVILITHDLGVMSAIADRVSIFYAGRVVESGAARGRPAPAAPSVHAGAARRAAASRGSSATSALVAIPGSPPSPGSIPAGCAFNPRCAFAQDDCRVPTCPALVPLERPRRSPAPSIRSRR